MQLPQLYWFVFYVLHLNIVESYRERVEYGLTHLSFASFNAPCKYSSALMYENRTVSIQSLILRLMYLFISSFCCFFHATHGIHPSSSRRCPLAGAIEACATRLCSHTFSVGLILEPRDGL